MEILRFLLFECLLGVCGTMWCNCIKWCRVVIDRYCTARHILVPWNSRSMTELSRAVGRSWCPLKSLPLMNGMFHSSREPSYLTTAHPKTVFCQLHLPRIWVHVMLGWRNPEVAGHESVSECAAVRLSRGMEYSVHAGEAPMPHKIPLTKLNKSTLN